MSTKINKKYEKAKKELDLLLLFLNDNLLSNEDKNREDIKNVIKRIEELDKIIERKCYKCFSLDVYRYNPIHYSFICKKHYKDLPNMLKTYFGGLPK